LSRGRSWSGDVADFVVGGAVPAASNAYVSRPFERQAFLEMTAGIWVLLLGPRQHGKTSALVRLETLLEGNGIRTTHVDFQAFGAPEDYAALLRWFAARLARAFGVTTVEPEPSARDDLEEWLEANKLPGGGSVAVLVDEAGAVPEPWQNRFFSQLRALYNRRATPEPESFARRAVFLFAGTFRPERLVNIDNSPFNVSRDVKTTDLSRADALALAERVAGAELQPWADAAFEIVGGQPYLLQTLLAAASAGADDSERRALFDGELKRIRHGGDRHIVAVFERALAEPRLGELLAQVAQSPDGIPFNGADSDQLFLEVLGPAVAVGDRLQMRNPLYRDIVISNPQFTPGESSREAEQFLVALDDPAFEVMHDQKLRQFADENFAAAVRAHNAGNHRLALAGFGSVLEAILLDHLLAQEAADLEAARLAVDEPPQVLRRVGSSTRSSRWHTARPLSELRT